MGIGAANHMTYWCLFLLFIDWISRREDAVVYRAGPSNQPGSLALRLWYKLDNFAHIRSKHWLENDSAIRDQVHHKMHPNAHCAFFHKLGSDAAHQLMYATRFSVGSRPGGCFGRIDM